MKYTKWLSMCFLFACFGQSFASSLEGMSLSELDLMINTLEQEIKALRLDISDRIEEYSQQPTIEPAGINCTTNDIVITNHTNTPWMEYTAFTMTALSTGLTMLGPGAELVKDLRLYSDLRKVAPPQAAGWPVLDFMNNAFFLAYLGMDYNRSEKLKPLLLNGLASLMVMTIEANIVVFLLCAGCYRRTLGTGSERALLIQ